MPELHCEKINSQVEEYAPIHVRRTMCYFDDLFLGSDTRMRWLCIYIQTFNWWAMQFVYRCLTDGLKGCPMTGHPFWALVVLYRMLAIFTQYRIINVWNTVSTSIRLPMMFLSRTILSFRKTEWTSTPERQVYILISRRVPVPSLATESPCDIWGCGWTICLLYYGPPLG